MNRLPAFLIIFLAGAGVGALITATALSTPEEDQERPRVVVDDATSPGATAIPEASTPAPTPAEAAEGAGAPGLAAVLESVPVEEVGALAGSISGTVALQSGEPIAGVRIVGTPLRKAGGKKKSEEPEDLESHVRRAVHDFRWREALRATAVTGEDGHYVLEGLGDAGYRLKATRDGYRLKRRQRRTASGVKPGAVVDFIASPSVTIPIDVRMPDGSLAREAELRIRHGDRVTRHERWSPSDNELTLDPGRVQLSATLDDRYHTEPVWVTADLSEAPAPVTLQLQSRGGVKGQVRFPAEEIGGSARVYLTEVPPGSTPDPQVLLGASKNDWLNSVRPEFSFLDLEPGTYLVGAGRGYQQVDVTDFVVVGGDVVEVELAIPPIDRSQAVVVRAYGPDGEELPDARASMGYRTENRSSTGGAQTVRRRDGSLWVLPGDECWDILEGRVDGTCFVQVESDEHGTRKVDIDPQAGLAVTVRFSSPAHLDLTVTGFTGSGYEGRMRANLQNPSEPMQYSYGSQQKGAISIEGSARLGPVEPGEYELQLTLLDGSSPYGNSMIVHAMPVTLGTGANSITMPLPSLYTLRVDLPEGQIAGQVQIQPVTDRTWSMRRRRPAEDGGTTFDGLPAGRYTIRVDGNPELMGQMEVEVPAALTVLFTPQKINALRVTITDPNGYLASLGFESGDLVVALNGSRFEGQEQLAVLGLALQTADKLTLTVLRDEEEFDIELETKRLMGGDPGGMIRPATR